MKVSDKSPDSCFFLKWNPYTSFILQPKKDLMSPGLSRVGSCGKRRGGKSHLRWIFIESLLQASHFARIWSYYECYMQIISNKYGVTGRNKEMKKKRMRMGKQANIWESGLEKWKRHADGTSLKIRLQTMEVWKDGISQNYSKSCIFRLNSRLSPPLFSLI